MRFKIVLILGILALLISLLPVSVLADPIDSIGLQSANPANSLDESQQALKMKALEAQLNGKAYGKTHEVAKGQFVELEREGQDPVWTVLGEFNDLPHNTIPEPDRSVNNSTIWRPDFNQQYYLDIIFKDDPGANSLRQYLLEQSSNRYDVYGGVTDWVKVPGDACTYDDDLGGPAVWQFLIDSVNGWYQMKIDAGWSPGQIDNYLSSFDNWDRYDWDGDGNFCLPGKVRNLVVVHWEIVPFGTTAGLPFLTWSVLPGHRRNFSWEESR